MHVMHVIDSLVPAGKERMLVEIANAFVDSGGKASVCVTRADTTLAKELHNGIAINILNRRATFDLSGLKKFKEFVKEQSPDVFHAHGRSSFSFLAFARMIGIISSPILLHDHFGSVEIDGSIPKWFRLFGKNQVAHYVGVCDQLGDWAYHAGIADHKISVIGNALDLSRIITAIPLDLHQELEIDPDVLIGVVAGRIVYEKGLDILIRAVAKLNKQEKVKYLVIGDDEDRVFVQTCKKLALDLNVLDEFIFLGIRDNVIQYIKGADFAVMPSRSESGPLVLIEYMASGKPIVATQTGNIGQQAALKGVPGFSQPGNVDQMTQNLRELLSMSRAQRNRRGIDGKEIALQFFNIDQVMPEWKMLYNSIIFGSTN